MRKTRGPDGGEGRFVELATAEIEDDTPQPIISAARLISAGLALGPRLQCFDFGRSHRFPPVNFDHENSWMKEQGSPAAVKPEKKTRRSHSKATTGCLTCKYVRSMLIRQKVCVRVFY